MRSSDVAKPPGDASLFVNVVKALGTAIDRLVDWTWIPLAAILATQVAITIFEVISRYVFNAPTKWTMDLSVFLLIWLVYLGMAYVAKQDRHVCVDLITIHFPPRTRAMWDIVTSGLFLVLAVLFAYYGSMYTAHSFQSHEYALSMWTVLLWPVKLAMPVGGVVLGLLLLRVLVGKIRLLRTPGLERGSGLGSRPEILVPAFLASIAGGIALLWVNPTLGMVALMFITLFGGVPIVAGLGLIGVVGFYLGFGGANALVSYFPQVAFNSLNNFVFVCVPLFIITAQILSSGGLSGEIYDVVNKFLRHFPGGELVVTIVACGIFAAISTSSLATAATITLIALPSLIAHKYKLRLCYGALAAGGTLGIMIPPSGTMILYSAVTDESIGKLFMAGVIPGLILVILFSLYAMYACSRDKGYVRAAPAPWRERFQALKNGIWGLLAPVIILGGIYSGIFTALESGAIAAAYSVAVVLIRRKMSIKSLPRSLADSTFISVMGLSIALGALTMGDFVTLTQLPAHFVAWAGGLGLDRWVLLGVIMVAYLVLGCFMDAAAIILVTVPIVYPLIKSVGFDGIWFGVLLTLNMEIGFITPPVGMNLFVISGTTKAPIFEIVRGTMPFLFIMLAGIVLFAVVPQLSTWLPSIMVGR